MPIFCDFKNDFIYLKSRERGREREISIYCFIPQIVTMVRIGPG